MFELWIPVTIFAAFMQNVRSALQKHLKGQLSTSGATASRFLYAFPLAILYVAILHLGFDMAIPEPNARFAIFGAIGGVAQIMATALLVYLFGLRNFAVGTTYSKTETIQTALFGIIILGDPLSNEAFGAILISLTGVIAISVAKQTGGIKTVFTSLLEKPALIGIASGACFGISAVSYRASSLSLGDESFVIRAAFTLACVTVMQSVIMAIYIRVREPGQLTQILRTWRVSSIVGLSGMLGSVGWFTAMTIQNAAYVRALGQVELVFTFIASYFIFKEKTNRTEFIGILLVASGILILLLRG
jgi:drug/metabolite transporter (DMT)-like permease